MDIYTITNIQYCNIFAMVIKTFNHLEVDKNTALISNGSFIIDTLVKFYWSLAIFISRIVQRISSMTNWTRKEQSNRARDIKLYYNIIKDCYD